MSRNLTLKDETRQKYGQRRKSRFKQSATSAVINAVRDDEKKPSHQTTLKTTLDEIRSPIRTRLRSAKLKDASLVVPLSSRTPSDIRRRNRKSVAVRVDNKPPQADRNSEEIMGCGPYHELPPSSPCGSSTLNAKPIVIQTSPSEPSSRSYCSLM
ncbi:hypothetical protein FGIG_04969 [Fasciola gigantica]|uniref:Uncharacterized protein n=1 Tax=Fasciola gigantica TaxID=46835 RepID=A0A504YXF7_FASGI|nr:hypothetical protein FGIG_04969 [Fasciola gigantica]